MKTLLTFIAIIFVTVIIIPVYISKAECPPPQPKYIKFKQGSAEFKKTHKAPGTCSEIFQNGEYKTKACYGVSKQTGTSPGTYKHSLSMDGVEWDEWTITAFVEKCQQTSVHWNNSPTVKSTNWEVTYKFTEQPVHSVSYYVKFTTGQPQKERKILKEVNISTVQDNSASAAVTTWIVTNPYPPNLPDGTYRAWRNSGETVYKLYKKENETWIDLYVIPK